jgi:hypothetical protein
MKTRRVGINDRLTANGGVCAYKGCGKDKVSKYHSYCLEHRRLIARESNKRYRAKKKGA